MRTSPLYENENVAVDWPGMKRAGVPRRTQRARAVVGAAAGARRLAGEEVAREVAEERDHALASMGLLDSARATTARANAAAKPGNDAPPHGSACGCVCATRRVHHAGPTGASHW